MNLGYVSESSSQRKSASSLIALLIGSTSSTWSTYKRKIWTLNSENKFQTSASTSSAIPRPRLSQAVSQSMGLVSPPSSFLTQTLLLPIVDNRSGRHEDYFWQIQSLMMPKKTPHKGHHIVNFTYELKLFLVLSNIHISQMNKEKELESNPGVVNFSMNFSTPF